MSVLRKGWFKRVSVDVKGAILILGISLALVMPRPLFSQANQGTIQGSVFDQSGGVIAGATLTVLDVARGVSRTLTTDSAGLYVAQNLIPGTYTVTGSANGFQTLEHANILVEVGQTVRVDLVLQPGAQTQTVTVTAEAPSVNASDATLGGTINQQNVSDLPVNGRDIHIFLAFRPGIEVVEGGGIDSVTANGLRTPDTGYLVDGLKVDEAYTGNSLVNSPTTYGDATGLPFDAIQEINNQENPKAEDGWKPGAIVNIGLKSGTNNFHGTAFALGRDAGLDARDFWNMEPQPKAALNFEQFGAGGGYKILKDKLFWFADYEGTRIAVQSVTASALDVVTTSLGNCTVGSASTCGNPADSLVDACLALVNSGNGSKITPLSAQLAGLNTTTCAVAPTNYTPGPNESLYPSNSKAGSFYPLCGNTYGNNNGIGKVDYHLNDHNSINGYFGYLSGTGNTSGANCIPGTSNSPWNSEVGPVTAALYSANWTWTPSATQVNEARVGYTHFFQPYFANDYNVNPLAFGLNTGVTDPLIFGAPSVTITGFSDNYGGGQHKVIGPDGALQILDHYSFVRGAHSFKVGGEWINNTVTSYPNNGGQGSFTFQTITNYLEGAVHNGSLMAGNPLRHVGNDQYGLFAQDDWRITRRLILNLGLRWQYESVLTEKNNLLGNFLPSEGIVQVGDQIKSPYNGDFHNFSPRLGLAWDVFGDGKTVVRAGASMMYSYPEIQEFVSKGEVLGITKVPTGATIVDSSCPLATGGCTGSGSIKVATLAFGAGQAATAQLSTNWQNQTKTCVSTGSTACGTLFPASALNVDCGDGLTVGGVADPGPCTIAAVNPNLRTPQVYFWTLGVQRAITNSLTLEATYVGTAGRLQLGDLDINQAAYGSGFTAAQILAGDPSVANAESEQESRPYFSKYPYLSYIDELVNDSKSNYDALEVTLSQRSWHGLSFTAGYTLAHTLDNSPSNHFDPLPPDSLNNGQTYGDSDFDIRNRVTLTTTYAIPGRKGFAQMLQGWQISSVVRLASGEPWDPQDSTDDLNGTGETGNLQGYGQLWDFVGNRSDFDHPTTQPISCWKGSSAAAAGVKGCKSSGAANEPAQCINAAEAGGANQVAAVSAIGCYYVGNSVLIPPALGTDGDATRGIFRGQGFHNWDITIIKDWKIKERFDTQFRAEMYNVLNHPNFFPLQGLTSEGHVDQSAIDTATTFGCTCTTVDQGIGNIVVGTGGPREIDLGLRLIW